MRIYWLEMKRVLKSRRAMILLLITLVMSAVMAYLPVTFESINYPDENGNIVELNGLEAIAYKKTVRSVNNGEVTPKKLKAALEIYQSTVSQYGESTLTAKIFRWMSIRKKYLPSGRFWENCRKHLPTPKLVWEQV